MKATKTIVGLGLVLLTVAAADAFAQQCQARIAKRSIAASSTAERVWNIEFEVSVDGCARSEGTFEFDVQLEVEGRTETATVSEDFKAESAGLSRFTVEYGGPTGRNLRDVRAIRVKTCSCY